MTEREHGFFNDSIKWLFLLVSSIYHKFVMTPEATTLLY